MTISCTPEGEVAALALCGAGFLLLPLPLRRMAGGAKHRKYHNGSSFAELNRGWEFKVA